eukprot:CFRG3780T1
MYPSAHLFKKIPCPFFQHGLCGRPYCHFSHESVVARNITNVNDGKNEYSTISSNTTTLHNGNSVASEGAKRDAKRIKRENGCDSERVINSPASACVVQSTCAPVSCDQQQKSPTSSKGVPESTLVLSTPILEARRRSSTAIVSDLMEEAKRSMKVLPSKPTSMLGSSRSPRVAHQPTSIIDKYVQSSAVHTGPLPTFTNASGGAVNKVGNRKRMAHTPAILSKPAIEYEKNPRIKLAKRQMCLDKISDELVRIWGGDLFSAYSEAVKLELKVHAESTSDVRYMSSMRKEFVRLKAQVTGDVNGSSSKTLQKGNSIKHVVMKANKGISTSASRMLTNSDLYTYEEFLALTLTEDLLSVYNFPGYVKGTDMSVMQSNNEHPSSNVVATTTVASITSQRNSNILKTCERCQSKFMYTSKRVTPISSSTDDKECDAPRNFGDISCRYHPSRVERIKVDGVRDFKYSCCGQAQGSDGCVEGDEHVFTHDKNDVTGFIYSPAPQEPTTVRNNLPSTLNASCEESGAGTPMKYHKILALDCEMCYTYDGLELARLTMVDNERKTVFDELVRPSSHVIDYNTKFSGISKEDMDKATMTIYDIHNYLKSTITTDTILIGHSLDSDLRALKLVHPTVIDTSELYQHHRGLPMKVGLKHLSKIHLNRFIQQDSGLGHDSKEDALAALDLVTFRLKTNRQKNKLKRLRESSSSNGFAGSGPTKIAKKLTTKERVMTVLAGRKTPK